MMKRIGIAFPGDPSHKATWSGIPFGLTRGLEAAGVEVVPVRVEPAPPLLAACSNAIAASYLRPQRDLKGAVQQARAAARASAGVAPINSWAAPKARRRAGRLGGSTQAGPAHRLPTPAPVATKEKMTFPHPSPHPYPGGALPPRRSFASRM